MVDSTRYLCRRFVVLVLRIAEDNEMTKLDIKGIRERVERAADISSDDFGHDTSALRDWCEAELIAMCSFEIPRILDALEKAVGALKLARKQENHFTANAIIDTVLKELGME